MLVKMLNLIGKEERIRLLSQRGKSSKKLIVYAYGDYIK